MKTILVHLNGTDADTAVLSSAWRVARPVAGHLEALRVTPSLGDMALANLREDGDSRDAFDALERQRSVVRTATEAASRNFQAFIRRENIQQLDTPPAGQASAAWREKTGRDADVLIAQARYNDLLVVAAFGAERLPTFDLGRILFEGGKPVLLAPEKPSSDPIRTVAIAWKDTPEAARAVTAAMPLLSRAKRVIVLIANEDNQAALDCVTCTDSLVTQLLWHGLRAEARYVLPAGRTAPVAVLETARETEADLLVMGAYGRSRWRETIFGGFTREVLEGPIALPVFLAH